jgi:hypothetical protein
VLPAADDEAESVWTKRRELLKRRLSSPPCHPIFLKKIGFY